MSQTVLKSSFTEEQLSNVREYLTENYPNEDPDDLMDSLLDDAESFEEYFPNSDQDLYEAIEEYRSTGSLDRPYIPVLHWDLIECEREYLSLFTWFVELKYNF